MVRNTQVPYLRLVDPAVGDDSEPQNAGAEDALLGFIDMSRTSDKALELYLSEVEPSWVFDLRPLPYFNIGRLNRKRAFALFQKFSASYHDVAGSLRIVERNDASLNSGGVSSFLNEALSGTLVITAVLILVDDDETLTHAMKMLPSSLRGSRKAWCPMALDVSEGGVGGDVVLRATDGTRHAFQQRWRSAR